MAASTQKMRGNQGDSRASTVFTAEGRASTVSIRRLGPPMAQPISRGTMGDRAKPTALPRTWRTRRAGAPLSQRTVTASATITSTTAQTACLKYRLLGRDSRSLRPTMWTSITSAAIPTQDTAP